MMTPLELAFPWDTPLCALATKDTPTRPGYRRPPGFTGGNLGGVCVPGALCRTKARASEPTPLSNQPLHKGNPDARSNQPPRNLHR